MARIPRVISKEVPKVTGGFAPSPREASLIPETIARGGAAVADAAVRLYNRWQAIDEERKDAARVLRVENHLVGLTEANENIVRTLRQSPDPDGYFDAWNNEFRRAGMEVISQIPDLEERQMTQRGMNRILMREIPEQKDYEFRLAVSKHKADLDRILFSKAKEAAAEITQSGRTDIIGEGVELIDMMEGRGILFPEDAEVERRRFRMMVQEADLRRRIADEPDNALKMIQKGDYDLIPEDRLAMWEVRAQRASELARNKADRDSVDRAINTLKGMYGEDYDAMFKRLRDPTWCKLMDLKAERKRTAEQILAGERILKDSARKIVHDETFKEAFGMLNKGTLTLNTVGKWLDEDRLSEEDARYFRNELEQAMTRERAVTTDFATIEKALDMIYSMKPVDDIKKFIASNLDKLSIADREQLLQKAYTVHVADQMRGLKKAMAEMKNQLVPQIRGHPEMEKMWDQNYTNALRALDGWVEREVKDGRMPTSADIINHAREITPNYQHTMAEWTDMLTLREGGEEALRKKLGKRTGPAKVLDRATAEAILDEAGGDPELARRIAKDRGYR